MPVESYFKFKDYELWLAIDFFYTYELLLFEELQAQCGEIDEELNKVKEIIAENALNTVMIQYMRRIDFNKEQISENVIQKLITSTESIIEKMTSENNYLTALHVKQLLRKAKEYLIDKDKFEVEQYPAEINAEFPNEPPKKNYLHAFYLIKLLLKGEIKHSDRNGLLVG